MFLFLLILGVLVVVTIAYENEVKDYMIQQLNKNLKTKVIVDPKDIQLTLLKSFPYIALDFRKIIMIDAPISNTKPDKKGISKFLKQDTLFSLSEVSLQFNVMDILRKKYVVKKISVENGKIKLKVGTDGSRNWDVWKGSGDTTSTSGESAFNLKKFNLENISVQYFDFKSRSDISCLIHSGTIAGEFTSKQYDLSIKGDMLAKHFSIDSLNYLDNKPMKMDFSLRVDNDKKVYQFSDGMLYVSDLKISVQGKYIVNNRSDYVDIFLKGKDMDVQSVLSLLPEKHRKHIRDFESEGEFYCNAHISGKLDDVNSPEIKADFGITKAEITQLSSGITLKDAHILGSYFSSSVTSKYFLDLKAFSASLANGRISGMIRVDNFSSPTVSASLNANLLLEDVQHLLKIDSIWNYPMESLKGSVKVNMEYKGSLNKTGKYTRADFENMTLSGELNLENAGMKIKNSTLAFDSINGSFVLNNNNITVNSFSGNTPKSDFYLKGTLKDVLAYSFSEDADINVEAAFQSNNLDLNEFLLNQKESSKRDTVYKIHFSPRLKFILNSDIGHLRFRKFDAKNIRGTFQLRNQKLIGDPISFSTMDGSITAIGMIENTTDSTLLITCDAKLNKLNINKLFIQLEDFHQNMITSDNLKGIATADVQFASVWKSDLTVDLNKIYVRSSMVIEKGELLHYEPMKSLSRFVELSELDNIKFATLQNQIEIKDQNIFIPKMNLESSAMNVTLFGTHSFENEIDYHFKVLLSDLLSKKARKAKKENEEFGVVEDDKEGKTSLFISMTGTVDNPVIKYDKQGAKQNLKANIVQEKQTLKQILKEEFGLFKKDTALNKKDKPKEDNKFIIKWDEDEKKGKDKKEDEDF